MKGFDLKKSDSLIQVVERCSHILNQFSLEEPVLGISEIARRTNLNKGTVYRILLTLEELGFVRRDVNSPKYRLGLALFHLGSIVQAGMDVRREALPVMQQLSAQVQETVNLNVVYGTRRVCLECVEVRRSVRAWTQVGQIAPLTRGASGKALLAGMSDGDVARNLEGMAGDEADLLRSQLPKIREQGYVVTHSERAAGVCAVSAPVRDSTGRTIASLSISGPEERFTANVIESCIRMVTRAAHDISVRLGYLHTDIGFNLG